MPTGRRRRERRRARRCQLLSPRPTAGRRGGRWRVKHAELLDRIREQPGIIVRRQRPTSCRSSTAGAIRSCAATRRRARRKTRPQAQHHAVSEGYFEAMGATHARGPPVHAPRHTRHRAGGHRQRRRSRRRHFPGQSRRRAGDPLNWASQVGPLGRNLMWAASPDGARTAAAPPNRRRRRRHPECGARPAGRARGVLPDAAVPVQRRDDRHRRARHATAEKALRRTR